VKLLSLNCNECGAPLEAPKQAKYLTCDYCEARLQVQHTGSAAYTKVIESIDDRTRQIAEDVKALRAFEQLERLDREWVMQRANFMVRGKDGEMSVPGKAGAVAMGIIGVGGGALWTAFAASMGAPIFFPLFGLLFIAFGLFGAVSVWMKAADFKNSQRDYQQRRQSLMRDLLEQR